MYIPVISTLRRERQEGQKFKVIFCYILILRPRDHFPALSFSLSVKTSSDIQNLRERSTSLWPELVFLAHSAVDEVARFLSGSLQRAAMF